MPQRIDARDVLDPNAKTKKSFRGKITGYFRRVGPNSWDDYEFVSEPGDELDLFAGIRIQLEDDGAAFRMRHRGRVVRIEWIASEADRAELENTSIDPREYFAANLVRGFKNKAGIGPAAGIAKTLIR